MKLREHAKPLDVLIITDGEQDTCTKNYFPLGEEFHCSLTIQKRVEPLLNEKSGMFRIIMSNKLQKQTVLMNGFNSQ